MKALFLLVMIAMAGCQTTARDCDHANTMTVHGEYTAEVCVKCGKTVR